MTNNDIIRRVRYIFDMSDRQVAGLFKLANHRVDQVKVSAWLKKDDDPMSALIEDRELAIFLNGLIIEKRGKREGPTPPPEEQLSNNMIMRKLKIALALTTEDILALFASIDKKISKNELSDFFRNPSHHSYRVCGGQYLRNFLNALQNKYRKDEKTSHDKRNDDVIVFPTNASKK